MQILIPTSDKSMYALRGFAYLWTKHNYNMSGHMVDVFGYSPLPFELPRNFKYTSIGQFKDYPAERWSDGFYQMLHMSDDPLVLIMMDDYWLIREVDTKAISLAQTFMIANPNIFRFDLSSDRMYASGVENCGWMEHYDLIKSNPTIPYHFSLQAGIFRREMLKQLVVPNESPWVFEMRGTTRLAEHPEWQVIGTQQTPMKYLIAIQGGKLAIDGGYQVPRLQVNQQDIDEIRKLGYLEGLT